MELGKRGDTVKREGNVGFFDCPEYKGDIAIF